ncbi:MAG: hypothetical protein ACJARD_000626 [Alphaproteobacteria bacterium]|jgi:hypothetical protein
MSVSIPPNHTRPHQQSDKKSDNTTQALKLGGLVLAAAAMTDIVGNYTNKTLASATPNHYVATALTLSLAGGAFYGLFSAIVPLWKDVTTYRSDGVSFTTPKTYLNLSTNSLEKYR